MNRIVAISLAVSCIALPAATYEPNGIGLTICLAGYNQERGQARYRADIDWGGATKRFHRYDLAATDFSGSTYLQFHDNTTSPGSGGTSRRNFTVSDVSIYPLTFVVVGMTAEAAEAFDRACHVDGLCSVEFEPDKVERISVSTAVNSPREGRTPAC